MEVGSNIRIYGKKNSPEFSFHSTRKLRRSPVHLINELDILDHLKNFCLSLPTKCSLIIHKTITSSVKSLSFVCSLI